MGERLVLAVVVSLAVHVALVMLIESKPRQADGSFPATITARLERAETVKPDAPVAAPEEQSSLSESNEPPAADGPAAAPAEPAKPVEAKSDDKGGKKEAASDDKKKK